MKHIFLLSFFLSFLALGSGGAFIGGGSGGGGITSINGDTTAAQIITGSNNISASSSAGMTTINGTLLAPKANPTFSGIITTPLSASEPVVTNGSSQLAAGSVSSPLTFSAGAFGCQVANGSQAGCLSSADWTTFNGKQNALPSQTGNNGKVLGTNGTSLSWVSGGGGGGSPGGANTQVQINENGSFGAGAYIATSADYNRLLLGRVVDDTFTPLQSVASAYSTVGNPTSLILAFDVTGSGYPATFDGNTYNYSVYSKNTSGGNPYFSPGAATGTLTEGFNPTVPSCTINYGSGGYTASGNTIVYKIYGNWDSDTKQGTNPVTCSVTDDSSSNPYYVTVGWVDPALTADNISVTANVNGSGELLVGGSTINTGVQTVNDTNSGNSPFSPLASLTFNITLSWTAPSPAASFYQLFETATQAGNSIDNISTTSLTDNNSGWSTPSTGPTAFGGVAGSFFGAVTINADGLLAAGVPILDILANGTNGNAIQVVNGLGATVASVDTSGNATVNSLTTGVITYTSNALAVGLSALANAPNTVAVGSGASASGGYGVAIGYNSVAQNNDSIAIGDTATTNGGVSGSIAIGANTLSDNVSTVAIGENAIASGNPAIAIGRGASANANHSLAVGSASSATNQDATAIGIAANASGSYTTVVGSNASSNATDGTAIGYNASATGASGTAIGTGSSAGAHQVVLGTSSETVIFPNSVKSQAAQTTLTATGTAVCSEPHQGSSYKKVVCYLSAYTDTNSQKYTFPTAFSHTPAITFSVAGATASVSTTQVGFTSTSITGFVFLEGY